MRVGALAAAMLLGSALCACTATPVAQQSPATSPQAALTPTPAPAPSPSPSPSAAPTPAFAGAIGLAGCPAPDSGQHALGSPGPPGAGVHSDASLQWSGCGSVTVPPGSARFITGDNWQLGIAVSCPNGLDYGSGGMGTSVKFSELLVDGSAGPDSESASGPWTDSGDAVMAHGGNYQLKIEAIDPRCRWTVAVYPA